MRQCFSRTMRWMSPDRSPDGWPLQGYDASQTPSRTRGWNHMEKLTPLKPVPPCLKVPQVSGLILPFVSRWGGAEWGWGGLTKLHGSLNSRNSWIKPYSVLHAVVSLSPSLIAVITDSAPIEVWQTERQMSLHADRQSCAVHQSSTLLPRYESAGLTINSVPWVQWLLPYSDRLARAASPSLHHKYTRRSSY